jgi:GNAT superfamily N-acetyltransferase
VNPYLILEFPNTRFDLCFYTAPFLQSAWPQRGCFGWLAVSARRNTLVGALNLYRTCRRRYRSCGTYVIPSWRRRGVATALWLHALHVLSPTTVEVRYVSSYGKTLIDAVKLKWTARCEWKEWNDMAKTARNLKGAA